MDILPCRRPCWTWSITCNLSIESWLYKENPTSSSKKVLKGGVFTYIIFSVLYRQLLNSTLFLLLLFFAINTPSTIISLRTMNTFLRSHRRLHCVTWNNTWNKNNEKEKQIAKLMNYTNDTLRRIFRLFCKAFCRCHNLVFKMLYSFITTKMMHATKMWSGLVFSIEGL